MTFPSRDKACLVPTWKRPASNLETPQKENKNLNVTLNYENIE